MSDSTNELKLKKRTELGKKCKNLKSKGITTAVIYNHKTESIPLQVESNTLLKHLANLSLTTIFDLDIDGKKVKALVKEVQRHPITDQITHISFQEIEPTRRMRFNVPIEITGVSPAVKNNLGTLIVVKDSVEVKCTLNDLPHNITVDISGLENVGNTIQIKGIGLPKGLELVRKEDEELTAITISELEKEIVIEETVASTEATEEGAAVEGEPAIEAKDGTTEEKAE